MGLEKITKVRLPFDLRHDDPSKNYGIHGLDIWFILKGKKGAVQFMATFPVYLPHVDRSGWRKSRMDEIMGYDVGYHARVPQYEEQKPMGKCDIFEGEECYYDGSSLRAQEWSDEIFSVRGEVPEKLLWEKLEQEYIERFGKEET